MKVALTTLSPMMLGALRFALASIPLLWVVPRPRVPWRFVVIYGLLQGLGQFGLLFTAMRFGMPAGLGSMVLQTQVFFTALLAVPVLGERVRLNQWLGLLIAGGGLALIASGHGTGPRDMTLLGFVLTVGAALSWAGSNLLTRLMGRVSSRYEPVHFIVWSSLVPVLPFLLIAVWLDGADASWRSVLAMSTREAMAVAYLSILATLIGYSLWTRLFQRHPATRVAPFSMLVPVIGLWAASYFLDEQLRGVQWAGVACVLLGLVFNQSGASLTKAVVRNTGG
jgi:O-acetylserine/cysteine efflux transporter